jgi:ABC-2 type transporter
LRFFLFDAITLLSRGEIVYTGPVTDVLSHFDPLGYPCPEHVNPADHLIDISTIDTRTEDAERESSARVTTLIQAFRTEPAAPLTEDSRPVTATSTSPVRSRKVSLFRQIWYLTTRNFWITIRDPHGLLGFLLEAVIIGTIVGWIFLKIPPTLTGIRTMQGFIYTVLGLQGYLLLLFTTYKVSLDMKVRSRLMLVTVGIRSGETRQDVFPARVRNWIPSLSSHHRGSPPELLKKLICVDIAVPFIFSVITYFMAGYRSGVGHFFTFFAVNLLNQFVNVSFAMWCVSLRRNFAEASLIANASMTFISLSCGYFIQAQSLPVYVRWIKYISYVYWGFAALTSNGTNPVLRVILTWRIQR